jgi:hypothetical protein
MALRYSALFLRYSAALSWDWRNLGNLPTQLADGSPE